MSESPKIKEIQTVRHDMSHCHFNPHTAFAPFLGFRLQDECHPCVAIEAEFESPKCDPSNCHSFHCFVTRTSQHADMGLIFCIEDL